ncbi:hypothetical protein QPK87_04045 [Kamptonema cortianum]|nr:hypothetical protein [Kamptonema cortianum]
MNLSHSLTPVIRVLLVCVCLSFVTGCIGASKPPTFVKVGKKYLYGNGVQGGVILIKKNMGNGWYLVEAKMTINP